MLFLTGSPVHGLDYKVDSNRKNIASDFEDVHEIEVLKIS